MENKCGLVIGEECEVGKVMMGRERRIQITIRYRQYLKLVKCSQQLIILPS